MAKSDYLEEAILNHVLRNTSYTSPATVYVALLTASAGEGGSLASELSGNGYARQAVTFSAPTQQAGAAECTNTAEVLFPEATGNWSEATHFAVCDAATAGNVLYHEALDAPRTASTGDQIRFPAGSLAVTES
jgi:hypothetical protein